MDRSESMGRRNLYSEIKQAFILYRYSFSEEYKQLEKYKLHHFCFID